MQSISASTLILLFIKILMIQNDPDFKPQIQTHIKKEKIKSIQRTRSKANKQIASLQENQQEGTSSMMRKR
jgi:hypothetical protein